MKKCWIAWAIVATVVFAACGSDDNGGDDVTPTAEPTSASASPTSGSEPPPEAAGSVEPGAYTAEAAFPQLTFDRMVEIEQIPGTENAVVV